MKPARADPSRLLQLHCGGDAGIKGSSSNQLIARVKGADGKVQRKRVRLSGLPQLGNHSASAPAASSGTASLAARVTKQQLFGGSEHTAWAHVACAYYVPELYFKNPDTLQVMLCAELYYPLISAAGYILTPRLYGTAYIGCRPYQPCPAQAAVRYLPCAWRGMRPVLCQEVHPRIPSAVRTRERYGIAACENVAEVV